MEFRTDRCERHVALEALLSLSMVDMPLPRRQASRIPRSLVREASQTLYALTLSLTHPSNLDGEVGKYLPQPRMLCESCPWDSLDSRVTLSE